MLGARSGHTAGMAPALSAGSGLTPTRQARMIPAYRGLIPRFPARRSSYILAFWPRSALIEVSTLHGSPRPVRPPGPGPRLRRPVCPADRAAGPRAACVREDRPARHHPGAGRGAEPAGADPLGRAFERVRGGRAPLRPPVVLDG